jgi:hypothetical protein
MLLSTESYLTTICDDGENRDYFFTYSKPFSSSKTKQSKASNQIINHLDGIEPHFKP